jgi:hypothetical protein
MGHRAMKGTKYLRGGQRAVEETLGFQRGQMAVEQTKSRGEDRGP